MRTSRTTKSTISFPYFSTEDKRVADYHNKFEAATSGSSAFEAPKLSVFGVPRSI